MNLLLNIGFCVTGFTIFVLIIKEFNQRPSKYAILLLTLWFIRFLIFFLKINLDITKYPFLILFDQNLFFLDGVFFYWFVHSFKGNIAIIKRLLHIFPFVLFTLNSLLTFIYIENEELVKMYMEIIAQKNKMDKVFDWKIIVFIIILIIFNLFFFLKSLLILKKYKSYLINNFSTLLNHKIIWLKNLIYFSIAFLLIPIILFFINYLFVFSNNYKIEYVIIIGMVITALYFSTNIITQKYPLDEKGFMNYIKNQNYNNASKIEEIFLKLTTYITKNETYKNINLTLKSLSEEVDINATQLSVAINTLNNTNFHEFINYYRIESIKKELISSNEQIIIIAYKNGFNSKSTFNSTFKKMSGTTPSEYRKKYKAGNKS